MIRASNGSVCAETMDMPWLARLLIAANDNSRPEPPPAATMRTRRLADTWVGGGQPPITARGPLMRAAGSC